MAHSLTFKILIKHFITRNKFKITYQNGSKSNLKAKILRIKIQINMSNKIKN